MYFSLFLVIYFKILRFPFQLQNVALVTNSDCRNFYLHSYSVFNINEIEKKNDFTNTEILKIKNI